MATIVHLVKRAITSLPNGPLRPSQDAAAARYLLPEEFALWSTMQPRDRRHSLEVLDRFLALRPDAPRTEAAAALLHDVGKNVCGLGWFGRVVATVVGPRGERFATYHDHERLGARLLEGVSDARTIDLVAGRVDDDARRDLCRADDL